MLELKIFQIITLIMSAAAHEYMHGWAAWRLGDSTAKEEGRLTLNPIKHIDLFGSIFLPFILIITNSPFVFGWAKPVPFNPYNLKDQKYGPAKVAFAGPLANLIIAVFFALILRFMSLGMLAESLIAIIIFINLLLMVFNLLPIPPLDGSKIISVFLPFKYQEKFSRLENYGFFILIIFVMFGFSLILPIIEMIFKFLTGDYKL